MLPYLITYLCLSVDPIYSSACNNGLNATAIQIHLKQDLDLMQQNIETEISKRTGKEIWAVGLTAYQVYSKEAFIFSTSAKPIADSLSGNINKTGSSMTLTWMF